MSKLQEVLNDKESMKQIQEIANMLGKETGKIHRKIILPKIPPTVFRITAVIPPMDFSQLFSMLGDNSAKKEEAVKNPPKPQNPQNDTTSFGLDMKGIMQLQKLMQSANKPDKNVAFLLALKPLLKEENQGKIDRIIKIFKLMALYPLIKESGIFGGDLSGIFG